MAVVLLALAGFLTFRRPQESAYPADGPKTHWMCDRCFEQIELTPAQYKEWIDSPDKLRHDPNYASNAVVFWCPKCKLYTVVRATVDKATGTWFIMRDAQGNYVGPSDKSR